jgi:hypothetical protein
MDQLEDGVGRDWIKLAVENVESIWLSFGIDLIKWIRVTREVEKEVGKRVKIFILVNNIEEARQVVPHGIDVLVIQGESISKSMSEQN